VGWKCEAVVPWGFVTALCIYLVALDWVLYFSDVVSNILSNMAEELGAHRLPVTASSTGL
jgi:hypothetical protein